MATPTGQPEYTSEQSVAEIQKLIDEGSRLSPADIREIDSWRLLVKLVLEKAFGAGAPIVSQVLNAGPQQIRSSFDNPSRVARRQNERHQAVLGQLAASIRALQLPTGANREAPAASAGPRAAEAAARTIFLVHGRNEAVKYEVAHFVEKHSKTPVTILHEQPNAGQTLIEKLERHADAAFAIVLLTDDDVGALKSEDPSLRSRARQNVILELGYFTAKLGRARVCPLVAPDVETPSDFDGVAYVPLDAAGGWKFTLLRELKEAGFEITF
jgi:predicted nucleotide-binding protein